MPVVQQAKQLPASPGPVSVQWIMHSVVAPSQSPYTLQTQTIEWSGQQWVAKIDMPPMKRQTAAPWMAFFASLHGMANVFQLGPLECARPLGIATGAPVVDGANNAGSSIETRGWTASVNGILLAGDFIQIGNRLHLIVNTENSDATGRASFDIWPDLRETPGDGTPIIINNPQGLFRLSTNDPGWSVDAAFNWDDFSFTAVEAI